MSNKRRTPEDSNEARRLHGLVRSDEVAVECLKRELDTFIEHRRNFDRALMIHSIGRICQRIGALLEDHLCDLGVLMHQETLTDAEYEALENKV